MAHDDVALVEAGADEEVPAALRDSDEDALWSASSSRRLLLALAVVQSSCSTGVLFGFSALSSTLMRRGQYSELCTGADTDEGGVCTAQKLRFSLIYTFASTCLFSSFLAFGLIVDKYGGPRRANLIGCMLVASGILFLSLSDSKTLDLFPVGFALIGLGGPGVHISLFHVALLFPPARKNTIQSFLVGAFVMSGIAFPVERWLIENTSVSRATVLGAHACVLVGMTLVGIRIWPDQKFTPGDSIRFKVDNFLSYVVISSIPVKHAATAHTRGLAREETGAGDASAASRQIDPSPDDTLDDSQPIGCDPQPAKSGIGASETRVEVGRLGAGGGGAVELHDVAAEDVQPEAAQASASGGNGTVSGYAHLHGLSLKEQLYTEEYRRLAIFMMIHALHFNFYLGTFPQQITWVFRRELPAQDSSPPAPSADNAAWSGGVSASSGAGGSESDLAAVIETFSLWLATMMPSAVVTLPLVGRLLDSYSLRAGGFLACNITGVLYGALALAPWLAAQWLTMAALSVHRMLLFSSLFAYTGSRFGGANFGSIVGITTFLSSLFGLLQYVEREGARARVRACVRAGG